MKKFSSQNMRVAAKIHHLMFLLEKEADTFLSREHNLSFMQALILNIIRYHPQTTQHFVVQCTRFTPGAVSRQIEILREKGMLTRKINKENRREHVVELTEKGIYKVEKAFALLEQKLSQVFTVISEDECNEMNRILSKLIQRIDPDYYKFEETTEKS